MAQANEILLLFLGVLHSLHNEETVVFYLGLIVLVTLSLIVFLESMKNVEEFSSVCGFRCPLMLLG